MLFLKLVPLGLGSDLKAIRQAIKRIAEYGNTTKHHESAANFNGPQIYNDIEIIKELLCKLAEEAKTKSLSK
jgi:hypothetical protein